MKNPILVALDTTDQGQAVCLAKRLAGAVGGVKTGLEFFNANGPAGVGKVAAAGLPVFLDLKFHDIPNTVAGAVRAATALEPMILNVHAAGGSTMMKAAAEAAAETAAALRVARPLVIAVTVLTSLDEADLEAVGLDSSPGDLAVRLASLAQESGLDGVVCSAHEIGAIRKACGKSFKLVVPGIRPAGSASDDQKRTMTPAEAMNAGADFLVIGRPITASDDPAEAARAIADSLPG